MPDRRTNPSSLVRIEEISKRYGNFQALHNVSFEIKLGEIVGFLGPNGAGKTTTMRILSGFFPPSSGRVWVNGVELFKHPQTAKQWIGYLPESVSLYPDMKVAEYLRFVAKLKGVSRKGLTTYLEGKMATCGLTEVGHRLIGRLSKGYRQRVGIAQALIGDPKLLILDEPTTGLDPKQIAEIRDLIRKLGKERGVILSTHILSEVSMLCHRVVMINRGQIIASGTVQELGACLKDREGIRVIIKEKKHENLAVKLLKTFPGVENLQISETPEDEICFSFETTQEDLRSRIAKDFVENGISVAEIQRVQFSLEEIFLHLIKDKKAEAGPL